MRILLLILALPFITNAQSLSPERVKMIKEATVRITIEGSNKMGTGFFFNNQGHIATCWHVIEPHFIYNNQNRIIGGKKIFVEISTGEIIEYGVPLYFLNDSNANKAAVNYDYCVLIPLNKKNNKSDYYLKLGDFNNLNEGDEVYTCGYPIGIDKKFISKGIVSTKYESQRAINRNGIIIPTSRDEALLDMTLNRGNSGGAIIKIGKTIEDDEVVGIADFIITPFGGSSENLIQLLDSRKGGMTLGGVDPFETLALFGNVLASLSIGVGGLVSINHFWTSLAIPR